MILPGHCPDVHVVRNGRSRGWQLYYVDPITEKRVWRSAQTKDRRAADRLAGQWQTELAAGLDKSDSRITWEDFRVRYLEEKLAVLAASTRKTAETALNRFTKIVNPARPASITAASISRFATVLRTQGASETTVHTYLKNLRIALRWAYEQELLVKVPATPKATPNKMRGRPITGEEFDRLLAAVDSDPACQADPAGWKWYIRGLWWSGLRLDEAHRLSWDESESFCVIYHADLPYFRIWSSAQKSRRDQLLPVAPEFAEMLASVDQASRSGRVFLAPGKAVCPLHTSNNVGRVISDLGTRASIATAPGKHCTAHDLRRSFGTRWSRRVPVVILQQLMRHRDIKTTMEFYVDLQAHDLAAEIWASIKPSINRPQIAPLSKK